MTTIALTGGVGTGKSTVVRLFRQILKERAASFDCDASVHELLTRSSMIGKLNEVFGEGILGSDGQIDRGTLRDIVFDDVTQRRKLEAILHPEVLDAARRARAEVVQKAPLPDLFIYEVPLLYEAEFPIERDADLVVAATRETQVERLKNHRDLSAEMIEKMLAAQIPLDQKMDLADIVIWNDVPESELREQVYLAIGALQSPNPSH